MQLNDADLLRTKNYINGKWQDSKQLLTVNNPANGNLIAEIADGSAADCETAVLAARTALPAWSGKTAN